MENPEMFHQKSVTFLAIAALMAVVIACSSSPKPTAAPVPPTATRVPTATVTPVPVAPIEIDPIVNPVGFLRTLPADEATCAIDAVGGRDRMIALMSSSLGGERLTVAEANALDNCCSEDTVPDLPVLPIWLAFILLKNMTLLLSASCSQ